MKILIISWYFPPANTIGAVRIGNLARFLFSQGHDIHVVGGKGLPYRQTLPLEFPEDRVAYARWADVNALPKWLSRQSKTFRGPKHNSIDEAPDGNIGSIGRERVDRPPSLLRRLSRLYQSIVNWPDSRIGWLPFAFYAGARLLRRWHPQVIFASGPPFTTLLVGYWLSRFFRVPLIVEFRDRWSDDAYYQPPLWRLRLDQGAERIIGGRAIAISTVSEPWAKTYRARHGKPVTVTYNGFDKELLAYASSPGFEDRNLLRIIYTGGIYPGRRDPSPLFEAIRQLGSDGEKIRVEFFGTDPASVYPLADVHNVRDRVCVHAEIDHAQVIEEQRKSDILLLMQWDDPKEQGNIPGKFFEYLGALRPILVLGLEDGVPATLVRELNAGVYCGNADAIRQILRQWLDTKEKIGFIPALPEQARQGFSRDEQFQKLSLFIAENITGA